MKLPQVSLCLATSLDGRISTHPERPPNFTSRQDLAKLYRLRAQSDALLIGAGTVRSEQVLPLIRDDALVKARQQQGKPGHPAVVVVSQSLDLPWSGRYFRNRKQRIFVLTGHANQQQLLRSVEQNLELLQTDPPLNLVQGLTQMAGMGFEEMLAEGGGRLVHALLKDNLVTKLYLTLAPIFIGGELTPKLVNGTVLEALPRFKLNHIEQIGDELHLIYHNPTPRLSL